ncbi:unnamed protein product [Clonostachys rosea f. rosea IK726]|uniref:Uncharacterized protein n=1 Tax=Clonostachys rosea f. rosea IK726 TaxID=1349383 RepID=A0ACA9U1V6_BIOOC|nr:unnamed protein product [Clonostachys rosea f. rosea IK726]
MSSMGSTSAHGDTPVTSRCPSSPPQRPRREFTAILGHRWEKCEFQIHIKWVGVDPTWVRERSLHRDSKAALLHYWQSLPNGRPMNPDDDEVFEVFRFRDDKAGKRGKKRLLLTEWVGYDEKEMTWEPEEEMMKAVPELVDLFWAEKAVIKAKNDFY